MQYIVQFVFSNNQVINLDIDAKDEAEAKAIYKTHLDGCDKALKAGRLYRINDFHAKNPENINLVILAIKQQEKVAEPIEAEEING